VKTQQFDAVVIGAGAAGMAAARTVASRGHSAVLVDREGDLGGILLQCIHNGFGLHRYGEELTGPEFSSRLERELRQAGVPFMGETTVLSIEPNPGEGIFSLLLSSGRGIERLRCRSVILAMGSRERNRGNVRIPGDRPAGVFTAGLAQRLMNIEGYLPGKRAVIVGSGDIGLIMARRLTLSGIEVQAVIELMSYPSGLARNITQCLEDFGIPLYLSHATTRIVGRNRVEGIEIAPIEEGSVRYDRCRSIPCDTVLLSVGLVPENELSSRAGVPLNPVTNGPLVDSRLMTGVPGIFACGNVLHIHDLVDRVAEEAERAGSSCADWLDAADSGRTGGEASADIPLSAGKNVRYTVPSSLSPSREGTVLFRSMVSLDRAAVTLTQGDRVLYTKRVPWVRPAEMQRLDIPAGILESAGSGTCFLALEDGEAKR